jgi:TolA-binding protein
MPTDAAPGESSSSSSRDSRDSRDLDYTHLRNEVLLLREKNSSLQAVLRDTQQRLAQRDAQVEQLRERNRKLEADVRDMHRLAEERAMEVKSLETFLTKTDRWAGAQIVQTVKDLNSEILQFAAAASETFAVEHREVRQTSTRQRSVDWLKARHGTVMCRCLERRDHAQDPTLLQYALQASISHSLCRALSSFVFGSPSKLDQILMKIYLHMHITGKRSQQGDIVQFR